MMDITTKILIGVGATVACAATGFVAAPAIAALIGGAGVLGAASTGTAIAGLSGAALTNAALAVVGGGTLAAGGAGVAGGTAVIAGGCAIAGGAAAVGTTEALCDSKA